MRPDEKNISTDEREGARKLVAEAVAEAMVPTMINSHAITQQLNVPASRIRSLKRQGKLTPDARDFDGHDLYLACRLGEIRSLLSQPEAIA